MRKFVWMMGVAAFVIPALGAGAPPQEKTPDLSWAFPVPSEERPPMPTATGTKPVMVPGSTKSFTPAQLADQWNPPDWFPDEHPPMPEVVARGRTGTDVRPCDLCHLTTGLGHPESANIAGMPASYLERQIAAWKNGTRKQGGIMGMIAKQLSDADAQAASEYFASLKPRDWVQVVEADTVPDTYVNDINMRLPRPGGGMEPLGDRIIEVPFNAQLTEERDTHAGTIAFVPKGSIAKGQELVQTGAGRTIACATCHGDALTGLAEVPRLAGLSPLYLTRALYNYQTGVTPGTWAELMRKPVAGLSYDDIVDIAAYLASLPAQGAAAAGDVGRNGAGAPAGAAANVPAAVAQNGNGSSGGGNGGSGGGNGANADLVAQGKDLYLRKYKCSDCHGVNGEGTDDGPDLVGTKLDADEIRKFLINPDSDARTKGMPNFDPGSPELDPLVAFVLSIKKSQ